MLRHNYPLLEAVEKAFNPATTVSEIKKCLNVCQLAKFKSTDCTTFYSYFFLSQSQEELNFQEWCVIYNTLINDDAFCNKLCNFIAMYQPHEYYGMFRPIMVQFEADLKELSKNRVRFISEAKAFFFNLRLKMDSVGETVKAQIQDPEVIKFITAINTTLGANIFYINDLLQKEMNASVKETDITHVIHTPISEDAQEILDLLENGQTWIDNWMERNAPMNEGIVSNAKEIAKTVAVKTKKAERAFEDMITRKVQDLRRNRRERKHAEMVGEALRINREIKRILTKLPIALFSPATAAILYVSSIIMDRKTDKRDRNILIGQIKDELEIVEEKISQAERNGDDKAKIELIRTRQKLQREYERVNKLRFDPSRMNR